MTHLGAMVEAFEASGSGYTLRIDRDGRPEIRTHGRHGFTFSFTPGGVLIGLREWSLDE